MCMHTAQHLISALLETRLQLPTPSWCLTPSPNPSYIEVPHAPTTEELKAIKDAANDYCLYGTRLHIEVEELDTAPRDIGDRNGSKALPADYTGGVKRTVVIDGLDRNPFVYFLPDYNCDLITIIGQRCCGTHLPTLQGLSVFILPQTEPLSRGRARIFFCAGPRLQAYLAQTHYLLTAAAMGYGCAPAQVPERLAFETEGRRKAHKRAEELEADVAAFLAKGLQEEYERVQNGDARRFTAFRHRIDSSPNPLGLLGAIHSAWCSLPAASTPSLVVLVSSGVQASSKHAVVLVFGSDEQEVKEVGESLKAKGIKGGGKGTKWSGKTENWKGVGDDESIKALLQSSKTT